MEREQPIPGHPPSDIQTAPTAKFDYRKYVQGYGPTIPKIPSHLGVRVPRVHQPSSPTSMSPPTTTTKEAITEGDGTTTATGTNGNANGAATKVTKSRNGDGEGDGAKSTGNGDATQATDDIVT